MNMPNIVNVRFKPTGRSYSFDAGDLDLQLGENVIVETVRGLEIGQVVAGPCGVSKADSTPRSDLKRVVRRATSEDVDKARSKAEKAARALQVCREKVAKYGLELQPVEVQYAFDNNKVTIFFTAEGRVDFRELARDLVRSLRARVELRQIGVRDEASIIGGIGPCGRPLCCSTFLTEFKPVSIKMAKEQKLSLNPGKISGLCGRLMCCLRFESEASLAKGGGVAEPDAGVIAGGEEGGCHGCQGGCPCPFRG